MDGDLPRRAVRAARNGDDGRLLLCGYCDRRGEIVRRILSGGVPDNGQQTASGGGSGGEGQRVLPVFQVGEKGERKAWVAVELVGAERLAVLQLDDAEDAALRQAAQLDGQLRGAVSHRVGDDGRRGDRLTVHNVHRIAVPIGGLVLIGVVVKQERLHVFACGEMAGVKLKFIRAGACKGQDPERRAALHIVVALGAGGTGGELQLCAAELLVSRYVDGDGSGRHGDRLLLNGDAVALRRQRRGRRKGEKQHHCHQETECALFQHGSPPVCRSRVSIN